MAGSIDARLSKAQPGDVLDISKLSFAQLSKSSSSEGQLFYSNNPEVFASLSDTALTLLCQNVVQAGETRCFLFHVNRAGRPAKVTLILEPVAGTATVTITRRALATPSTDYGGIGRQVEYDWFRSQVSTVVPVAGPVVLDPALEQWSGGDGALFHALYTWQSDLPVRVTVAALPAERSSLALYGSYLLVNREGVFSSCPEDFRARGLYLATKQVTAAYDTGAGNRWLPVGHFFCTGSSPTADGPTYDGWVLGQDNTPRAPGDTVTLGNYLPGNFGVRYRFLPQLTGTSQVAVLLNPLGGYIQGAFSATAGITPGGVTPYGPFTGSGKAVLIARYSPGATPAPEVQVMPGGNVSLPWRLLLVPYRQR